MASATTKVQETVTIQEACRIALVVPLYMRKLVRDDKIQGHKDRDGRWRVVLSSVEAYATAKKAREEARINRIRMGIESVPTRPTTASCARFRKAIAADKRLSAADKQTFLAAVDRYEAAWDRKYKTMLANRARDNGKVE